MGSRQTLTTSPLLRIGQGGSNGDRGDPSEDNSSQQELALLAV